MAAVPYNFSEGERARAQRLRIVEQQIAQLGEAYAPSHLLVERDNLQSELDMSRRANTPQPSKDLYEAVDDAIRYHALMSATMQLSERVYEVQSGLNRLQQTLFWALPVGVMVIIVIAEVLARL